MTFSVVSIHRWYKSWEIEQFKSRHARDRKAISAREMARDLEFVKKT